MKTISPCISKCKIENSTCVGCYRTAEEIRNWSKMNDIERELVLINCDMRLANEYGLSLEDILEIPIAEDKNLPDNWD
jgi:predicted Fe-S protein YdhL (DUF1289 family)